MAEKRPNSAARKGKSKVAMSPIFSILLILGVIVGGYFGGQAMGFWGAAPDAPVVPVTPTTPVYTSYEFGVYNYITGAEVDEDDHEIYIYSVDISDMDADEISDLEFTDFTLDTSKNSGETFVPETDMLYKCYVNGSDIIPKWFDPALGSNNEFVMNATEDVSLAAYSLGGVTVNQTDYRDWNLIVSCLDASESTTAKKTDLEGYMAYFNFENDTVNCPILRIECNTTAELAFAEVKSAYNVEESRDGNYLYYKFTNMVLFDAIGLEVRMGSGLGTDFEIEGFSFGYGESAAVFDAWDAMN